MITQDNENKTDALIDQLCQGHCAVKRLQNPFVRVAFSLFLTAAYVVAMVAMVGVRADWADKLHDMYFLFETGLGLFIWISSAVAASWLCIPDMRGKNWLRVVPLTLTAVVLLWTALRSILEEVRMFPFEWVHCFNNGLMMGGIPFLLVIFLSRQGTTCSPHWMALMNALTVSMAGWIGLRLICPMNDMGHGFLYHLIPYVLLGTLVGLAARRLFRW